MTEIRLKRSMPKRPKKSAAAQPKGPHFIRAKQAAEILGVSVTTIWNWAAKKTDEGFPRPIQLTKNVTVFPADEIVAFAQSKRLA